MRKPLGKCFCRECGARMICDDIDYNFKGNFDQYWVCPTEDCMTSCVENIRYGHPISEEWHTEKGDKVEDIRLFYARF